ncbi:hypothetical protein Mp_5g23910 [Marchantia polymorpha subsp. ruderalis]|uniref:Uncharacterized protein n=2 Tax=Marchantia polymorpha TaxID=3197 RepID=A0AAF6BLM5_MARPO|nr:hypothetical protein MARPO_0010s0064 [Marchantia polymorpha]BBN12909.1 hypothetical protein Mp_5g23910 [Marchantia polymorpha subsp. ruderalis]|eukprot:PTQ46662.1 hypothetical protein MARPO_0010s0064 [Marchantia polymorpha]
MYDVSASHALAQILAACHSLPVDVCAYILWCTNQTLSSDSAHRDMICDLNKQWLEKNLMNKKSTCVLNPINILYIWRC